MDTPNISWLTERPISHRGLHDGNRLCWENTLPSFQKSVDEGYAIECDVTLTADGVPIVFHDHDLMRLTGKTGKVCEITADEICKLEIGGTADRVPRLSETLELVAGRVPMVIELKGNEGNDEGMVAAVARDLAGYSGNAAIMSFAHHLVRQFADQAPGIPAGLTAEHVDETALEAHFSMLAHPISFVSFDIEGMPNRFVAFVRDQLNMPFITWTVRTQEAANLTWLEGGQITFEGFVPENR